MFSDKFKLRETIYTDTGVNVLQVSTAFYKTAMVDFNDENFGDLISGLAEFEKELGKRATRYFGGKMV